MEAVSPFCLRVNAHPGGRGAERARRNGRLKGPGGMVSFTPPNTLPVPRSATPRSPVALPTGADGGTDQDLSRAPKFSGRQEALDRRTKFCLVDVPATIEPRLRLPSRDHRVVGASGVHSNDDQATGRRSTSSYGITSPGLLFKQPLKRCFDGHQQLPEELRSCSRECAGQRSAHRHAQVLGIQVFLKAPRTALAPVAALLDTAEGSLSRARHRVVQADDAVL